MIALRFVRRPLDPHQADVIRRRAWGVSVLLYALGIAATIPLIVLVAQGNAPRMLVHSLAIALIVLICFVPTAIAYARSPMREPRIVFARYDDERVVCEIELIADTTVARLRSAGFAWGIVAAIPRAYRRYCHFPHSACVLIESQTRICPIRRHSLYARLLVPQATNRLFPSTREI